MIGVRIKETVTCNDIKRLVDKYNTDSILIVIENTKYQSPEELEEISQKYPKVLFSVLGGLDPVKKKFNYPYYQYRTYFNPMELSKIIKIFQQIERGIELSWTDRQKVMYVYQQICNNMEYSECQIDHKDYSRGLGGLLYGKAVCSGFAMIFKEALDRLGYKNIYQNRQSSHSWNIVYLDGEYRAFELTWDTYHKSENGCMFYYFNRTADFYKNPEHDLSKEQEETEYKIVPYDVTELKQDYNKINNSGIIHIPTADKKTENLNINGCSFYFDITDDIKIEGDNIYHKKYTREDGSSFIIIYQEQYKNLNKFLYFEANNDIIIGAKIYSESRLDLNLSDELVADQLLSAERLKNRINNFNGYVGYINKKTVYANQNFEKEELNIIR